MTEALFLQMMRKTDKRRYVLNGMLMVTLFKKKKEKGKRK
jgi:hypothetical protein